MNQEILSPEEHAVWVECAASPQAIKMITMEGGFQKISLSHTKQIYLQDILDNLLTQRLLNVRIALRDIGWETALHFGLTKEIDGCPIVFNYDTTNVGAGNNISGITYKIFRHGDIDNADNIEFMDNMTLTASDMARGIENQIAMKYKLQTSDHSQHCTSETLRQAIPDTDGSHGIGFRDALESVMIALQAKGIDPAVSDVITTALDAYSNHYEPTDSDSDPARKFCAQVARMSTYEEGVDENGDAAETMNSLIRDARGIVDAQEKVLDAPSGVPEFNP